MVSPERLISDHLFVLEDLLKESDPESIPERIQVIQRIALDITNACNGHEEPLSNEFWKNNSHKIASIERSINKPSDDSGSSIYSTDMLGLVKKAERVLFEKNLTD